MNVTITDKEIVSIPRNLLNDFVIEFDKMKKIYEIIDHTLAEKDLESKKIKSFKSTKALFNDLDN
jgi:hypothetical protein